MAERELSIRVKLKDVGPDWPRLLNIDRPTEKKVGGHRHHKAGCLKIPQALQKIKQDGHWEYFPNLNSLIAATKKQNLTPVPCKICGG